MLRAAGRRDESLERVVDLHEVDAVVEIETVIFRRENSTPQVRRDLVSDTAECFGQTGRVPLKRRDTVCCTMTAVNGGCTTERPMIGTGATRTNSTAKAHQRATRRQVMCFGRRDFDQLRLSKVRRCVRRLTAPATMLPEILFGVPSHVLFECLGVTQHDRIDIGLAVAGWLHGHRINQDGIAAARLTHDGNEQDGHFERSAKTAGPRGVLAGRPKNGTNVLARPSAS